MYVNGNWQVVAICSVNQSICSCVVPYVTNEQNPNRNVWKLNHIRTEIKQFSEKSTANQRKEHNTEKYIHVGYNAVAEDTGLS